MNIADKNFIDTCFKLINHGTTDKDQLVRPKYEDGTPAHTKFITQVFEKYDLDKQEFPIITLRPIAWKSAIKEILWIYQDESNDLELLKNKYNIKWWDSWDIGDGTIGQRYGATVKKYDLMNKLLKELKEEPYGRRHIMDLYQYEDFNETKGLYPCAYSTLWSVRGEYLDMTLIQRSSDFVTANSINKIQYVALQMMIAKHCGYKVGNFAHYVQNLHIYDRHEEQLYELLKRKPSTKVPKLILDTDKTNFYDFTIDDFKMIDYEPVYPQIHLELGI